MRTGKSQSIGIAVWGVGNHARKNVLPAIRECNALNLIGIGTRDANVRAEQSNLYDCQAWSSLEDILSCPEVKVVYLATPISLHHKEGMKVYSAGRHLWCEKSLTAVCSDSQELHKASLNADLGLCLVCAPRYHAQFTMLRELLGGGTIGPIRSVTARFDFPHMEADNIRYRPELGGSALLDLGFYPIVMAIDLFGENLKTITCRLEAEDGYEVDTSGNACFETDSGIRISTDWGYGRTYRNEIEIEGERGSARISPAFSKPAGRDISIALTSGGTETNIDVPETNQFVAMLDVFAKTLTDPVLRSVERDRALETQQLLERVRMAAV